MSETSTLFSHGHSVGLSPANIERELSSMWKPVTSPDGKETQAVTRVVLGNVIWIGNSDRLESARAIADNIIPKFPCRLFLLEFDAENTNPDVVADVTAQCIVPKPGQLPVCGEVIHLKFGPAATRHVRGCVVPLLLADLQTVLWNGGSDAQLAGLVAGLEEFADRIITRLTLSREPAKGMRALAQSERSSFDLAWFRLAPVREQTAAFFDDRSAPLKLDSIDSVRIRAQRPDEDALHPELIGALFVGWLAFRLGWKPLGPRGASFYYDSPSGPVEVMIELDPTHAPRSQGGLSAIRLRDRAGDVFEIQMSTDEFGMCMVCGSSDMVSTTRKLMISELAESDAFGTALNAPTRVKSFRESAALTVPLLEHFCK